MRQLASCPIEGHTTQRSISIVTTQGQQLKVRLEPTWMAGFITKTTLTNWDTLLQAVVLDYSVLISSFQFPNISFHFALYIISVIISYCDQMTLCLYSYRNTHRFWKCPFHCRNLISFRFTLLTVNSER